MDLKKPKALKKGDTIGIVAPSMHIIDNDAFNRGVQTLKNLGFEVKISTHVTSKYRNTTETKENRAKQIHEMFENEDVKAIVNLIGGDASSQLLNLIDYDIIRKNPKIFCGMSDICHLHLAFLSKANLISLHGIDLTFGFGAQETDAAKKYNIDLFKKVCMENVPLGPIPSFTEWEIWKDGKAKGRIVGGWIGAVIGLYGTQYWPKIDNSILFWEAIGTEPHIIERQMAILEADGYFSKISGMIIGKLVDCVEKDYVGLLPPVKEIILEICEEYNFPIIANVDFGHDITNIPLPEGILTNINTEKKEISLMESFVL